MPERSPMSVAGDTVTVQLPRELNGAVTGVISGGVAPNTPVVSLELSADDQTTWEIATLNRPDRSTVTQLLAAGQSGWCEAPAYTHARLRLISIVSGTIGARLNVRPG